MTLSSDIQRLIERLNQELDNIEREATEKLPQANRLLSRFPGNARLTQLLATLNNTILFINTSRRFIQMTVEELAPDDVTSEEVQEAGEELSTLEGRIIEIKTLVSSTISALERLQ
ncbi:MAG TPA: restriction endonuclease subunit S [Cyanobacteria bacterium UBA12227]|nr:restriction endonuclease subunit S [Cyanobacteria bacterium UBA12227]HAX87607.1 restriction endonuclease subunit S [Cyanobacteria bacterium UBA11370]HBY81406.1 restriction endonuclease subunit S [Cyanobacteria bacterium UBA11148]